MAQLLPAYAGTFKTYQLLEYTFVGPAHRDVGFEDNSFLNLS